MKFKLNMFDQESTSPGEVFEGDKSPVIKREVTKVHEYKKVCPRCKSEQVLNTWADIFGGEPATLEEKASWLASACKSAYSKEQRLKSMSGLSVVYAMLGDRGDDVQGKAVFDSLDDNTKALYIRMAKKVTDHVMAIYSNRREYKTYGTEHYISGEQMGG